MLKGTGFARYSKSLSWGVSLIALILAVFAFTSGGSNSTITGLLWFGLAITFAISAVLISRNADGESSSGSQAGE